MYVQLKQDILAVEQREISKRDWYHAASTYLVYIIAIPRDYVVPKESPTRGRPRERRVSTAKKKTSVALVYKKL